MTTGSATDLERTPRWVAIALAAILLWAGGARVWMASSGLNSGHYWDERYSVKNVRMLLEGGTLEPANYYYPSLSYLPQAGVFAAIEGVSRVFSDDPFTFFGDGGLHPTGYLIARLMQVAYALGTLLLTFLLGRRLISAPAGLIAALLLAVAPQHVRLSTMWKPDILLLLAILLALWWSFDALDHPTLGRYALAGVGVGLALASKLNGGPIAVPLTIGAIVAGRNDRRHWKGLILAGLTAALVFVALNPSVGGYLGALERNREIYDRQVRGPEPAFVERVIQVTREELSYVLSTNFHGAWVGIAAIAGLLAVAAAAIRRREALPGGWVAPGKPRPGARLALGILAFPLTYTVLYAASTAYAKENNFLQILPFTALAAAFVIAGIASLAARFVPLRLRAPVAAGATLALALAVAAPTQAWVYRTQVPETWDLALDDVSERLRPWDGRIAYVEASRETLGSWVRRSKGLLHPVDDLAALPADLLDQADAEVFARSRADAEGDSLHARRVDRVDTTGVTRFEPRWFVARGPAVVAVLHPREPTGSLMLTATASGDGVYRVDLPASAGELVSAEVTRRRVKSSDPAPELLIGEQSLRLQVRTTGAITAWLSERFPSHAGTLAARIDTAGGGSDEELSIRIYSWR